jgi:MscS family membrane protein
MELFLRILFVIGIGAACTFLIRTLFVKILPRLTRHSATSFDEFLLKSFADLTVPLGIIVTLFFVHNELPLNPSLNIFYEGSLRLLVLVAAVRFFNRFAARFLQGVVRRVGDDELQTMFLALLPLIRALFWIVGSLVYLQSLGMKMAAIWALLSAGGIGIGLALKDPAMELFAYLMILVDKPFRVGQFINIGDTWATIERIGVRSTHLRNVRGELVIMNNSSLTNGVISNFADMPSRRLLYRIGVTYDTSIELMEKVPALISSVVNSTEHATFNRCHFIEFADSSLNFELVYYVDTSNYVVAMDAQQYINLGIMKLFEQNGIEFAFPTQTIFVEGSAS